MKTVTLITFLISSLLSVATLAEDCKVIISEDKTLGSGTLTLFGPCDQSQITNEFTVDTTKEVPAVNKIEIGCQHDGVQLKPEGNGKCYFKMNTTKTIKAGEVTAHFHVLLGSAGILKQNEVTSITYRVAVDSGNQVLAPLRAYKSVGNDKISYKGNLIKSEKDKSKSQGLVKRYFDYYFELKE